MRMLHRNVRSQRLLVDGDGEARGGRALVPDPREDVHVLHVEVHRDFGLEQPRLAADFALVSAILLDHVVAVEIAHLLAL